MRSAILGFVAGAAWLQMQPELPGAWAMLGFAAGVVALVMLVYRLPTPVSPDLAPVGQSRRLASAAPALRMACLALSGFLAGFTWAALVAHLHLREQLPEEWEGRDITVIGTVDSLPYRFERGIRFNFAVERVVTGEVAPRNDDEMGAREEGNAEASAPGGAPPALPSRLALSWYGGWRGDDAETVPSLLPGQRWQLTVRLRRPHGNANPHGFDYEAWLLEQGLRATGYVRPDKRSDSANRKLDEFVPGFSHAVERSRDWLRERIVAALPNKEYAGVIVALVVGDQRAIAQSDWQVFNRTGIGHLISI